MTWIILLRVLESKRIVLGPWYIRGPKQERLVSQLESLGLALDCERDCIWLSTSTCEV